MTTDNHNKVDQELLEKAAKAAGLFSLLGWGFDSYAPYWLNDPKQSAPRYWNPLTNDDDALRLAVKLDIHLEQNTSFERACALWYGGKVLREELFEPWGDDKQAATRRAIVRAAAKIGYAEDSSARHNPSMMNFDMQPKNNHVVHSEQEKLIEAINHANVIAAKEGCTDCGREHMQLAAWLKELQTYKEPEIVDPLMLIDEREQLLEEVAKRAEAYAYMSANFIAFAEEIRRMK